MNTEKKLKFIAQGNFQQFVRTPFSFVLFIVQPKTNKDLTRCRNMLKILSKSAQKVDTRISVGSSIVEHVESRASETLSLTFLKNLCNLEKCTKIPYMYMCNFSVRLQPSVDWEYFDDSLLS